MHHVWTTQDGSPLVYCAWCLVVRRADGLNGPCKGPVGLSLRTKPPEGSPAPDPALKGAKNGNCNRGVCQRPGATWYNVSTRAWYCPECASSLNFWSRRDEGKTICFEGGPPAPEETP